MPDTGNQGYESYSTDSTVSELFGGNLSTAQALEKLRTRLLDLSSRNRLLNYKHPKARSIQFVNRPNLNLIFDRLVDGKPLTIRYVPDPPPSSYQTRRPDAKTYAQSLAIEVDPEFPASACGDVANRHAPKLQTLYYPADLDKLCRKLGSEARTIIEETGSNLLYLVFGFLEFYETEDSERPMLAPLLAVPVTLEKGGIDPLTRTYEYHLTYSGEDIHENQTLKEKLDQDFSLQLPVFEEESEPCAYFTEIQQAVRNLKRWRIRHQLTLAFLSFGKLAIWDDLDANKWPGLLNNELLGDLFSGATAGDSSLILEDYEIDTLPSEEQHLIYDADSSQHSAIIDVLAGKNMVINGPPGTGKSQTITNIIAAGLKAGKKILFVSEKLAALEVVRHRLNQANLGHFCLELHSHKTQKKKLLGDIQERLDARFQAPQQYQTKLASLVRQKQELNRYAELMASALGNELGLSIHEIFWRTERKRQTIGDLAQAVQSLFVPEASKWTYLEIEAKRSKLESLGQLYSALGNYDAQHPWWGFNPNPLVPGDSETIAGFVQAAQLAAGQLSNEVATLQKFLGLDSEPTLPNLINLANAIQSLPPPPGNIQADILPRIFNGTDPLGKQNRDLLAAVIHKIEKARDRQEKASALVLANTTVTYDQVEPVVASCQKVLAPSAFAMSLSVLADAVDQADLALGQFGRAIAEIEFPLTHIRATAASDLRDELAQTQPLYLADQSVASIKTGIALLKDLTATFSAAYEHIVGITENLNIPFDGTPHAIIKLKQPDGIEGILPGKVVNESALNFAKQAATYFLADQPLSTIDAAQLQIRDHQHEIAVHLAELGGYCERCGLVFDTTPTGIAHLATIAGIAAQAPQDLLAYRRDSYLNPVFSDFIAQAEQDQRQEQERRSTLEDGFYLDSLSSSEALRAAIRVFRRGDSFFNFLKKDWRESTKLFQGITRLKGKRKAKEYETQATYLLRWIEHRQTFETNQEYQENIGGLFKGIETDFGKVRRLHDWYIASQRKILEHPGLAEKINLTTLDAHHISQLAAWHPRIQAAISDLTKATDHIQAILGQSGHVLNQALLQTGYREYSEKTLAIADNLKKIVGSLEQIVHPSTTPTRAVELIEAKLAIAGVMSDLAMLATAETTIQHEVGQLLTGIGNMRCAAWPTYLGEITRIADACQQLVDSLEAIAPDSATTSEILIFVDAKLALDKVIGSFAPTTAIANVADWYEYAAIAENKLSASKQLIAALSPAAKDGRTPKEVVLGLGYQQEAENIISSLSGSADVAVLLEQVFVGFDTDLASLMATLEWSQKVIDDRSICDSALRTFLLTDQAPNNYQTAKYSLQEIVTKVARTDEAVKQLSGYGEMDWELWDKSFNNFLASSWLTRLQFLALNINDILPLSKYHQERRSCLQEGLSEFISLLESRQIPPLSMEAVFEYVTYRSIGRTIYQTYPELNNFAGAKHDKTRAEFAHLDKEIIGLTGMSIAYGIDKAKRVPEGQSGYRASDHTEMQLLRRELAKQKRHIPIRQLIKRAGRAIQALKPCFMMGPMSVAQYLEQGAVSFDMVVMDEASQLRPEEALGAIARGKQVVIVGDPKQLPPTSFFDRMIDGADGDEDEDDTPAAFAGSESILDICQQLFHPIRTLRWHYRSQHHSLIEFSNHHFYNSKLIVFPSPYERNNRLGVRYRFINDGVYKDRQNLPEALRVADAVLDHMLRFPEESLGVVTLNQTQRDLIEDVLDKKIRNIPEAQAFSAHWEEEGWPFFIKNLENVQGDERDVIFISTTFGKAPGANTVRQNFGPISRPNGWRRLNVLFTRARRKVELFTSMRPTDIVESENMPAGTKALRDYLTFASQGIITTTEITGRDPDSDFEVAVSDALQANDYEVVPQLGVAGFFIDIAVRNPDRPGEFLAAIECDGATYHSGRSARDRDRIRQMILESLGWKDRIWRIWSTDWFYDPRRETERLLAFLESRRRAAQHETAFDYEFEVNAWAEDEEVVAEPTPAIAGVAAPPSEPGLFQSEEELFVEVGDLVTYCFKDAPEEKHTVMIVDSESNPRLHLINENAPLARALLECAVGDEAELEIPGKTSRTLKVLKIVPQRDEAVV